jgi:hypothetical protein
MPPDAEATGGVKPGTRTESAAEIAKRERTNSALAAKARERQEGVDREQADHDALVDPSKTYNGVPADESSLEEDAKKRKEKFQSQMSTFNGPWDARLNYAYNETFQVGNDMPDDTDNTKDLGDNTPKHTKAWKGSPSIANPYALIRFHEALDNGNVIIDPSTMDASTHHYGLFDVPDPKANKMEDYRNPKATNLIRWSQGKGVNCYPYYHADFLYCKYYGLIPNNYLLTLRRYPAPVMDNGQVGGSRGTKERKNVVLPVAQAITWLGEETGNKLAEILGFTTVINWKILEGEVNRVEGNEVGADAAGSGFLSKAGQFLGVLTGSANFNTISGAGQQQAKYDPYDGGPYANRVYGGVNVISKTYARDRGLDFKNSITLNFHYSLESLGGINAKKAMLDHLSNLLALVTNNASFWGGANRYFPNVPQYPFPGGAAGRSAWFSGNPEGFLRAMGSQMQQAMANIKDMISDIMENPLEALKELASGGAKLFMAHLQHGNRPAIISMKALLTGEAVGEWHLTVGNPMRPIATIGNLIVTEAKFEFGEQLGADDFPEDLKVSITLEHGKPRDKGDIESIFNNGMGRMHYSHKNNSDLPWNVSSSTRNSKIDSSWGKGHSVPASTRGTRAASGRQYVAFTGDDSDFDFASIDDKTTTVAKRAFGVDAVDEVLLQAAKLATDMGFRNAAEANPKSNYNVNRPAPSGSSSGGAGGGSTAGAGPAAGGGDSSGSSGASSGGTASGGRSRRRP